MCILVDEDTRVLVQGITGRVGRAQTRWMLHYGTKLVAGVTPGKGGEKVYGVPVYDMVDSAVSEHPAEASILFVPPPFVKDAAFEAVDAGIKLSVIVTENVPIHDLMDVKDYADSKEARIVGPTTAGIICPGKTKIGIMPANVFTEGNVGVVSRSGTLAYEISGNLTMNGIGQSVCIGVGADPVVGMKLIEVLRLLEEDEHTSMVVVVGEIGGIQEEEAAEFIKREMSKEVIAYVAGRTAPEGVRMGHAGAIVLRGKGTAQSKMKAFKRAGVHVAKKPSDIAILAREIPQTRKRKTVK